MFDNKKEAKENGEAFYYTGKPCKYNHLANRYSSNGVCIICAYENVKAYINSNREYVLERDKRWRQNNPEKEKTRHKKWQLNNLQKCRLNVANRKAKKLKATPKWANLKLIKDFYLNCPEGYEVDHIVPLQGKEVSGLHVESNLQYLTPKENKAKGNIHITVEG